MKTDFVIVVNGAPGSGKDTFCNFCCNYLAYYGNHGSVISTVDLVKKLAKEAGWNGEKDLHSRKGLSDLKDVLTQWLDAPWRDVHQRMSNIKEMWWPAADYSFYFIMVREPKEIERYEREDNAISVFIQNDAAEAQMSLNHADSDVRKHHYHCYIENNGTLGQLEYAAVEFINSLVGEDLSDKRKAT